MSRPNNSTAGRENGSGGGRGNNPSKEDASGSRCAPANARVVKSSAKTGRVSRRAARSAAKAISQKS